MKTQKNSRKTTRARNRAMALAITVTFSSMLSARAGLCGTGLPTGAELVSGQASISQSASSMQVSQSNDRAIINWQSFNIGSGAKVNFQQPTANSVALNRVLSADPSRIDGSLSANGKVFLVNPSGIIFGTASSVNVGGLVASTMAISDSDFNSGVWRFTRSSSEASILNQGKITASDGGLVALLGASVRNEGVIEARLGSVILASGEAATLTFGGNNLYSVAVDPAAVATLIDNRGIIQADGGAVVMRASTAGALLSSVINTSGTVRARSIAEKNGTITLLGDMENGTTIISGTLDASAPEEGDGGFIETSGGRVRIDEGTQVTTFAAAGKGGTWLLDPTNITIESTGGSDLTGSSISATQLSSTLNGGTGIILAATNDITINQGITWAQSLLTLRAGNNITFNAAMNGSGTAGLALYYGQASPLGGSSTYSIKAPITLASTGSFSTQLGYGGALKTYTIITSLGVANDATSGSNQTLQGMTRSANLSGNYVLGADITASETSGWSSGFTPIGTYTNGYAGTFDGLGHTITGLSVKSARVEDANVVIGLFGRTMIGSTIRNVGLLNVSIDNPNANLSRRQYFVGGLVGDNFSTISNSYMTGGSVSNHSTNFNFEATGGLVGDNENSTISNCYASGVTVTGRQNSGGLAGANNTSIISCYETGCTVNGGNAGGLVGANYNIISNCYTTGGSVTGIGGGLVGYNEGTISNSFYNSDSFVKGIGSGTVGGVKGMNTAAMKVQANFSSATPANGNSNPNWNFTGTWILYENNTTPLLRSFMPSLTVTANASKTYDGQIFSGNYQVSYNLANPNVSQILGTPAYSGNSQLAVHAGTYTITTSGLYSNQQGYIISYNNGNLTINPAPVTVSLSNTGVSKVYDGRKSTTATAVYSYAGLLAGDAATVSATGTLGYNSAKVNDASYLTILGLSLTGISGGTHSSGLGDYTLSGTTAQSAAGSATITARQLTVNAAGIDKVYDATTASDVTLSSTDKVAGDNLGYSYSGAAFGDKNVGTGKTVTVSGIVMTGTDASNYALQNMTTMTTASISAKRLTVYAYGSNKVYDGTTASDVTLSSTDKITGDDLGYRYGDAAFGDKNVGTGKTVTVSGIVMTGTDASNYALQNMTATTTGEISPLGLSVTGLSAKNKFYDTTTAATLTGTPSISPLSGDNVTLGGIPVGRFADSYPGFGKQVTVTGNTIGGADAGNYILIQQSGLSADISPLLDAGSILNTETPKEWDSLPIIEELNIEYQPFILTNSGITLGLR